MVDRKPIGAELTFWDGRAPQFDASILMTIYQAEGTLAEAVASIFAQEVAPGARVQLIMGVDPSNDGTWELARALVADPPAWLTVDCFLNELPNIVLGGRRTGRSNFLNCYSRIRGATVLFLNCDDAWRTTTKLQAQIDHTRRTGEATCTALETDAPNLKRMNDVAEIKDPFRSGNSILMSSFATPYIPLGRDRFWWDCPFLDWPIVCVCWHRFGITRLLAEKTFYRLSNTGAWSSQKPEVKQVLIRSAVHQMILRGPYPLSRKVALVKYLRTLKKK